MVQNFFSQFSIKGLLGKGFEGKPESGTAVAVIGDVHGYLEQYRDLVMQIEDVFNRLNPERRVIVQVGDLIDRGPDSAGCIDFSIALRDRDDLEFVPLLGNHELMMKHCLRSDDECAENAPNWMLFGGRETFDSLAGYGACPTIPQIVSDPSGFRRRLARAMGERRCNFLDGMQPAFLNGSLLVLHAGVSEGEDVAHAVSRPWDEYHSKHWAWNREPSENVLELNGSPVCQVHGHSIHRQAGPVKNRFAVDSGVYRSGVLSAALFMEGGYEILTAKGRLV